VGAGLNFAHLSDLCETIIVKASRRLTKDDGQKSQATGRKMAKSNLPL
jgi:hypothetical protein